MNPPLMIGTVVRPYGKIAMVGFGPTIGERYYWLVDRRGGIAMMPADMIEQIVSAQTTEPPRRRASLNPRLSRKSST